MSDIPEEKMLQISKGMQVAYGVVAALNLIGFAHSHQIMDLCAAALLVVMIMGQRAIDGWRAAAHAWRDSAEEWRKRAEEYRHG